MGHLPRAGIEGWIASAELSLLPGIARQRAGSWVEAPLLQAAVRSVIEDGLPGPSQAVIDKVMNLERGKLSRLAERRVRAIDSMEMAMAGKPSADLPSPTIAEGQKETAGPANHPSASSP